MPTSSQEGKGIIRDWISEFSQNVKVVLDLGVGEGTYHTMLTKKKHGRLLGNAQWIGIEAWEPYIKKYNLNDKYDKIINADIRDVNFQELGNIDLTIAGDVLEHISKDDSIKIVNNLLKVSKVIIISIPIVHYPQDEIEGNPYEVHVKDDWSHSEVIETFPNIQKYWTGDEIGVYYISL